MKSIRRFEEYPAIYSASKVVMPNIGKQSLTVTGVGLDEIAGLSLVSGDKVIVGESLRVANAGEASATFDLTGAKLGDYSVVGICGSGKEIVAPEPVSVILREGAKANLEVSLQAPTAIRANRWYEAIVTVKNTGDADAEIPIVVLNGEGLEFKDPDGSDKIYSEIIHLLPISDNGNPVILEPGEEAIVRTTFRSITSGNSSLYYNYFEKQNASWHSIVAQGELDDVAWADYFENFTSGFESVEEFITAIYAKASTITIGDKHPVNALRLYDLVQKCKAGNGYGVISAVVRDVETSLPVPGMKVQIVSDASDDAIVVTTGNDGDFVAYGVPTGALMFASENCAVSADGKVVLGSDEIACVELWRYSGEPIEEREKEPILSYRNLQNVPDDHYAMWLDGGEVFAVDLAAPNRRAVVEFGEVITGFNLIRSVDGFLYCVGSACIKETNYLFSASLSIDQHGNVKVSEMSVWEGTDGAYSISPYFSCDGVLSAVYSTRVNDFGLPAVYSIELNDVKNVMKRSILRKEALQTSHLQSGVSLALPSISFSKGGIDISVGFYVKDVEVGAQGVETSCCRWKDYPIGGEIGGDVSFGGKLLKKILGESEVSVGASGKYKREAEYRCAKWCNVEPHNCAKEYKVATHEKSNYGGSLSGSIQFPLESLLPASKVKDFIELYNSTRGFLTKRRTKKGAITESGGHLIHTEEEYNQMISLPDLNFNIPLKLGLSVTSRSCKTPVRDFAGIA